jgi:hypothetical protein
MLAIALHIPQLVQLPNMFDLGEVATGPKHELLKQRPLLEGDVDAQAPHELVVDECVVDVGVVASVELYEVGRDVVPLLVHTEWLIDEGGDDIKGKPTLRTEDSEDGTFRWDVPQLVVLHRILAGLVVGGIEFTLLLLQDSLEDVVAGYVVGVFLPTE